MAHALLRTLLLMVCSLASVAARSDKGLSFVQLRASRVDSAEPPKCVVWHSQHKSAGMAIELILSHYPLEGSSVDLTDWKQCHNCTYICDRETWDCGRQTCDVEASPAVYDPRQDLHVAYRGYTPRLVGREPWGTPGDGRCVWATMSRDPLTRLVSAYLWCKHGSGKDPLCGARSGEGLGHGLNATTATIQDFAKHWGNFLMRELMWHPDLYALAGSRAEFKDELDCFSDPWVQFKLQLAGGDDIRTSSGRANLKAVEERLLRKNGQPPLYDVYGVFERWNETMAMFDEKMPLADTGIPWQVSWEHETAIHTGVSASGHGSSEWKDEEERLMKQVRTDPDIAEELGGDIYLYNKVILPKFERDMKELKESRESRK